MKKRFTCLMFVVVLSGCASSGESQNDAPAARAEPTATDWTSATPMGMLGHRLGTYLTIEGMRSDAGKTGTRTMSVDRVNGEHLRHAVQVWIDNVESLPKGERLTLRGYESGRFIGLPPAVEKALGAARQAPWQFRRYFLVVPIDMPASVTIVPGS